MKQNFKKYLLLIVGVSVAIAFSCGLTSCGGGGGTPAPVADNVDDTGLPPDPGEAGKATLAGVDSDDDGVRDDVQIAIFERYPNNVDKRAALTKSSMVLQDAVLVGGAILNGTADSDEPFRISDRNGFSVECLLDRFGASDALKEIGFLEVVLTNTNERDNAYNAYNSAISGQSLANPYSENPCQ